MIILIGAAFPKTGKMPRCFSPLWEKPPNRPIVAGLRVRSRPLKSPPMLTIPRAGSVRCRRRVRRPAHQRRDPNCDNRLSRRRVRKCPPAKTILTIQYRKTDFNRHHFRLRGSYSLCRSNAVSISGGAAGTVVEGAT